MGSRDQRVCNQSQRILNRLFFLPPSSLSFFSFLSFLSLPLVRDMSDILLDKLDVAEGLVCMGGGASEGGGAKGGGPTGSTQYRRSRMLLGQTLVHERVTHYWYEVAFPGARGGLAGAPGCKGGALGGFPPIPPLPIDFKSLTKPSGVVTCVEPKASALS